MEHHECVVWNTWCCCRNQKNMHTISLQKPWAMDWWRCDLLTNHPGAATIWVRSQQLPVFELWSDVDALQTCRCSFESLQPTFPIPWSQTTSMQAPLVGSNTGWPCFLWSNGRSMTILAGIYYRQAEEVCIACISLQLSISHWVPPLSPFHNVKAKYLRRHHVHDAAYMLHLLWNLHQDSDRSLCEDIKQGDKFLHNCSGR